MASFAPIRAVERAIDVLGALNRCPVCTLDMLHRKTGIPKPTLIRLLETLQGKGLVTRAAQYGAYSLTCGVRQLSCGYHGAPRLVEAAMQPMDDLTRKLKWPIALAVPDHDAVVIRYSTIPTSPLSLLHSSIHMRLSLVSRALGRAYLAFCTAQECRALLDILALSDEPEDALAGQPRTVQAMLRQIRQQGYALRLPGVRPVSNTLAVPVFEGRRVVASIGLTWIASVLSQEQAVQKFLPPMQEMARQIKERLGGL
ncbi:regulatory proteins, IclR [Verminephrobacter eiseniae EF01-2]|uniref:Regulatory proteins, IclR n=1 Tax=Verminephrobacter eiseniae (strain EF01-2) TaxID=391735 RepID=A1WMD8_VEREI|nr:DNA-binding transcriptional regulator [Verminephrobacter eiseniae]ABM58795.1 regulatory proteins, IclR [Verminephrobacter eiseniae EF01-2]MCW5259212.1 DNA-binding transcriptional regulator [Verminephrobacter eiseniae]